MLIDDSHRLSLVLRLLNGLLKLRNMLENPLISQFDRINVLIIIKALGHISIFSKLSLNKILMNKLFRSTLKPNCLHVLIAPLFAKE